MKYIEPSSISLGSVIATQTRSKVYCATMDGKSKAVCLKRVSLDDRNNLEHECSMLKRVESCRNVPRVLALCMDQTQGFACLLETLIHGAPVHRLFRHGVLSQQFATYVWWCLGRILSDVHSQGVVHGDIKLPNVLIGLDGTVSLVDFGLSCDATDAEYLSKNHGTFHTRAPETFWPKAQRSGLNSYATDIWAFGVFGFEVYFGRPPFGSFNVSSQTVENVEAELNWDPINASHALSTDLAFRDLMLKHLLVLDPTQRSTNWKVILEHPYFTDSLSASGSSIVSGVDSDDDRKGTSTPRANICSIPPCVSTLIESLLPAAS